MFGRACQATFLVALFIASMGLGVVESTYDLREHAAEQRSQGVDGIVDVPSHRIGDKWVYETKFDVARLLAQANVSASLNALTGDTTNEVTGISYITDTDGTTALVYEVEISGSFTSANGNTNCGATLEGVSGRVNIEYRGLDILRARDLGLITSDFFLGVDFLPCFFGQPQGWLKQDLGDLTFNNSYAPAKERHDFPARTGDQWYMPFNASTVVTGTSDYFDPSQFDTQEAENNSWQVIKNEAPVEDGDSPQYSGCDDSYKIAEWNATGVNTGFNWYCPAVRGSVWNRIINPAGFTIDWVLKTYSPADSNSVVASSSPGGRNTQIHVIKTTTATLPNAMEQISIDYNVAGSPPTPIKNTNLQLRYEVADTVLNPTTDNNGQAQVALNVSSELDDTPSSDDYTSNGVVVYDPVAKIVGATTVVQDLSVVGLDLIAQASSVIVERTRGNATTTLSASIGYNALPGDVLSFSLPAQNRGVLTAPSTFMEIVTPDGVVIRDALPSIAPYSEERLLVDWEVPSNMTIGTAQMSFTVDPDENITADANRSNNAASLSIFIGRAPTASLVVDEGKYTFENITLNATASFDIDGGDVDCRFEIESRAGLVDIIEAPDCFTRWNWSNSGSWSVNVVVVDEELDVDSMMVDVVVLNRAPIFNLTHPESVEVESPITVQAVDISDIDTTSPSGQQVTISWPGLNCDEGLTQPTCTFTPMFEGPLNVTAVAMDDDGDTTVINSEVLVLNIPPTISPITLFTGGQEALPDENGTWHFDEDEVVLLRATAADSANDEGTVLVEWHPSIADENWTLASIGVASSIPSSWNTSGEHTLQVRAIDADGATSSTQQATVMIHNVPPSVSGLPEYTYGIENDPFTFSVNATDTTSDIDNLEICWDLDSRLDADNDGVADNDCELNGTEITYTWTTDDVRWVTVTVIDDDGATAKMSMNISIINEPPRVLDALQTTFENLTEGDNLTLNGLDFFSDTLNDKNALGFQWDSSHLDTNLDGEKVGDVDFTGSSWTMENLPAGTWTITVVATDDDGATAQQTLTISVSERPPEGIIESITSAVGTTTAAVIGLLGFLILALVMFLFFTRRGSDSAEDFGAFEQSQFANPEPAASTQNPFTEPAQQEVAQAVDTPAAQQPTEPMATETSSVVNTGPPLPATGLPDGWSMEQWNYYGEQWLANNPPAQAAPEPIRSDTAPPAGASELQSLLDDLDI